MSDEAPFSVLGIALVVEERGHGARLIFRYPAVPEECDADNLFFTLPHRTMAKIFRPKKPLCNQPMTISLGGTVFCCRAVLMSPEHVKDTSALVLFSVIVSLVPSVRTSAIPIAGWFEQDLDAYDSLSHENLPTAGDAKAKKTHLKGSASFLAVRKIHVSLARVCRVLEREEKRCRYVAVQSARLQKIAEDFKTLKSKNERTISASTSKIGKTHHRRTMTTGAVGGTAVFTEVAIDRDTSGVEVRKRQERDQEVTDLMLAAKIEGSQIHGNLARELLQVFHAMSRTNESSAPISSAILSARDCTVFINRHLAVPIDSIAQDLVRSLSQQVRPYHTLLFPHVVAAELAYSFTSSNSRMKQFLSMLDSSKSLSEISNDAAMPLSSVIQMATYLTSNSVCIVSHVISKKSTLACCPGSIERMNELALQFSQLFCHLSIHCVVNLLTIGCSIEELIDKLGSGGDCIDDGLLGGPLRELIADVQISREEEKRRSNQKVQDENEKQLEEGLALLLNFGNPQLGNGGGNKELKSEDDALNPSIAAMSALESFLMMMAAWLGAHSILTPKQEYLVARNFGLESNSAHRAKANESSPAEMLGASRSLEENLCEELLEGGCLNGKISSVAMCWRFGLDERTLVRLRSWGRRAGTINRVWRVPTVCDDEWEISEQEPP